MDEISRYAVGLDVGTSNVRAVVAGITGDGSLNVVGYGEAPNQGMRKGVVANLNGPAQAIDAMLGEVERMKKDVDVKMISAGVTMTVSIIKLVIQHRGQVKRKNV